MSSTINIVGTGGNIEGNLETANVNVNLDAVHDLDGSDDYLYAADHNDFSFGDGSSDNPFSVSAWIYMDDATNFSIISKGTYNSTAEYAFKIQSDNKIHFWIADESVASCHIGRVSPALTEFEGTWIHVAGTYNGNGSGSSDLKIYINGVQVDNATDESNAASYVAMENLAANLQIGKYSSSYANGKIADVRVYAEELTAPEIQVLASKINVNTSLGAGTANLKAYWPIAGTSIDITDNSANSHNLTASGSPATVYDAFSVNVQDNTTTTDGTFTVTQGKVECKALSSLTTDGNGDLIYASDSFASIDSTDKRTMAGWVYLDDDNHNAGIFGYGKNSAGANQIFEFYNYSSGLSVHYATNNSGGSTDLATGRWYHIAATYDGSKTSVYIDGVLDHTDTRALSTDPDFIHIGSSSYASTPAATESFNGHIRDVRLYDYDLSADQIASLYSGSYPQTPMHWWKLDEGTGSTANDEGTGTTVNITSFSGNAALGDKNGTLDLDGALTIAANGTLSAPRGTLEFAGTLWSDSGAFTHNNGTVLIDGGSQGIQSSTFYNLTSDSSHAQTGVSSGSSITVENALTINSGKTFYISANSGASTITMGTTTSAGSFVNNGTSGAGTSHSYVATLQGASNLYPCVVTGNDLDWDRSGGTYNIKNLDYQTALTTGGSNATTITLTGDCEFDAVTVSSGDTFDLNGQRAEFSGTLHLLGTCDFANAFVYMTGSGILDDDGTDQNANSLTLVQQGTSTTTADPPSGIGTYFYNQPSVTQTMGKLANVHIFGAGTQTITGNPTGGDLTIVTGATVDANDETITVAGDFTTSGGLIGKSALDMDGSSTTVEVSDASDFDGLTNATWMGWFKLDDISADRNFMGQSSSFSLQIFENSTNKTRFSLHDGSSFTDLEGNTTITVDNKWHHIAFVMDGSNNKMYTYIDGKLDAEGAWTGTLNGSGADIYLGGYRSGNEKHFAGLYDSASIWNVALTPTQIRAKMFSDFASLDSNTGCVGFWQFDEGTGTSVASSVGSHTGTIANGTWAGAGTFTVGTSTLVMAKSGSQKIYTAATEYVRNFTVNAGSTTDIECVGSDSGSPFVPQGSVTINGTLSSTSVPLYITNDFVTNSGTFTFGGSANLTGLNSIRCVHTSGTINLPACTTPRLLVQGSGGTIQATGNLGITTELEVLSGATFNANGNTIDVDILDVNGGTLDMRNSDFTIQSGGAVAWHDTSSTILSGNTTLTGYSSANKADTYVPSAGNFEIVGDVKWLKLDAGASDDYDLTVIGSVIDCEIPATAVKANIRQWHHTLDTQQLLDADENGDDDLRLTKPALDNALELMTK